MPRRAPDDGLTSGQRAWRKRKDDPAYREAQSRMHRAWKLEKRYGITVEDYDRMLEEQGGVCAICGTDDPSLPGRKLTNFSVDHDHETGAIRGLLCQPCNMSLGLLEDHLEAALVYLGRGA